MNLSHLGAETGSLKLFLGSYKCVESVDRRQHTLADVIPAIHEYQK